MSALLLVDESSPIRDRLASGLASVGFSLAVASDAPGALERLRERPIDAIVLHVRLPKLDGIALIPLMRRITQVPIIMMTENGDLATRIAALAAGADDILTKPVDLSELTARISSALRRPQLRVVEAFGDDDTR